MVRRMLHLGVLAAVVLSSASARADYVLYRTWLTLSRADRNTYLAGSMDGWLQALMVFNPVAWKHFDDCVKNTQTTPDMLRTAVEAFGKDKPKFHMGSVQTVALAYLGEACGPVPTK